MSDLHKPALSARLHRLVAAFHLRDTAPQTDDALAASVSAILGKPVRGNDIEALRAGTFDTGPGADPALLTAIAVHFGVPAAYLIEDGGPQVESLDNSLALIAAAREAGVQGLALRGDAIDLSELAEIFTALAAQRKPSTEDAP